MDTGRGEILPTSIENFKSLFVCNGGEKLCDPSRARWIGAALCFAVFFIISYFASSSLSFHDSLVPARIRSLILGIDEHEAHSINHAENMKMVLYNASMPDGTVIITTLNAAWAEKNTMIDMFLESFQHGYGTQRLLQHLIIVCFDQRAYLRCMEIHSHCLKVKTGGVDFSGEQLLLSQDYIKLIWTRINFLEEVLEMNHSFIFTDTDVLWLRDPFPLLQHDSKADMQMACDQFNGKPWDLGNRPNAGWTYVRANEKTRRFYRYWYSQRNRSSHMADQEVFNAIKFEDTFKSIGMNIRFLDTQYIGGFCGIRFTDMTKAYTMHATCCKGLSAKLSDLRALLDDWKKWKQKPHVVEPPAISPKERGRHGRAGRVNDASFNVPGACWKSWGT